MDCAAYQAFLSMDFPGKHTRVGCHFLLQEIFLTQGSNPPSPALAGGFFTTEPPEKPSVMSLLSISEKKKKDFKRTVRNRHVDEITFLRNEGRYFLDLLNFCISRSQEMSNQQYLPSELTINILCKRYSLHKGQMLMVRPRQSEKSIDKNIFVYNLSPWIFWALYMLYKAWTGCRKRKNMLWCCRKWKRRVKKLA